MKTYIIRRLLYIIPILLGVTLITFFLFNVVGDPVSKYAGKYATNENIENIKKQLGLDLPLPLQYLEYLKQIVTLDFGKSWSTHQSISQMMLDGMGPSLTLTLPPFLASLIIAISLALFSAYYRQSWVDKVLMLICQTGMSISFLVYIIIFQYLFAYKLGWFPINGFDTAFPDRFFYTALPGIIMVTVSLGADVLMYRSIFLEEIFQDYVRTARAKGLSHKKVYFKHILKNAMIPIITMVILEIPFLLLGSFLLEAFFGIPGLGGLMLNAVQNSDLPVIKATTVFIVIGYVVFTLISDICYKIVNPRVELK